MRRAFILCLLLHSAFCPFLCFCLTLTHLLTFRRKPISFSLYFLFLHLYFSYSFYVLIPLIFLLLLFLQYLADHLNITMFICDFMLCNTALVFMAQITFSIKLGMTWILARHFKILILYFYWCIPHLLPIQLLSLVRDRWIFYF